MTDSIIIDSPYVAQPVTVIPVAGEITHVPEFHDCQRFVRQMKWFRLRSFLPFLRLWRYDSLYAIFASESLDVFWRDTVWAPVRPGSGQDSMLRDTRTGIELGQIPGGAVAITGQAHVFAEIVSWDGTYRPLGIGPGFNCLLLTDPGQPRAFMIQRGYNDPKCEAITIPSPGPGVKELIVRPDPLPYFAPTHYPAVARWDWDTVNAEHYIGLRCGNRWCEIGDTGFVSSVDYTPSSGTPLEQRVVAIKGWYDEQRLDQGWPSYLRGTAFPDPGLDTAKLTQFDSSWVRAAYVAQSTGSAMYQSMFSFEIAPVQTPTQLDELNIIDLCRGTSRQCKIEAPPTCDFTPSDSPWWVRIISPTQDTVYKCVVRRTHPGLTKHIPGAVRWRWMASDETTWVSCAQGCCETRP